MRPYVAIAIALVGLILFMTGGIAVAENRSPQAPGHKPEARQPQASHRAGARSPSARTASSPDDIRDIRGPIHIPDPMVWLYYGVGICILLLAAAGVWRWFGRRGKAASKTAFETAFDQLGRAKALMRPETAGEFSTAVSMAIRAYIEARFGLPVTRHTTEEFMNRLASDPPGELGWYAEVLHGFLEQCDLAKFARYALDPGQMERIYESAWDFVEKTRPGPEEKGPGGESGRHHAAGTRAGSLLARVLASRKTVASAGLTDGGPVLAGGG